MKVFISQDIPVQGIDLLRAEGFEVTVWQVDRPLTQTELIEYANSMMHCYACSLIKSIKYS